MFMVPHVVFDNNFQKHTYMKKKNKKHAKKEEAKFGFLYTLNVYQKHFYIHLTKQNQVNKKIITNDFDSIRVNCSQKSVARSN